MHGTASFDLNAVFYTIRSIFLSSSISCRFSLSPVRSEKWPAVSSCTLSSGCVQGLHLVFGHLHWENRPLCIHHLIHRCRVTLRDQQNRDRTWYYSRVCMSESSGRTQHSYHWKASTPIAHHLNFVAIGQTPTSGWSLPRDAFSISNVVMNIFNLFPLYFLFPHLSLLFTNTFNKISHDDKATNH